MTKKEERKYSVNVNNKKCLVIEDEEIDFVHRLLLTRFTALARNGITHVGIRADVPVFHVIHDAQITLLKRIGHGQRHHLGCRKATQPTKNTGRLRELIYLVRATPFGI